jgi:hypothetical protein
VVKILPEGKFPHSWGQRALIIHPKDRRGLTPRLAVRKNVITFQCTLVQRIRDIPNDNFDEIAYMEGISMSDTLDEIIPIIENESLFYLFKSNLETANPGKYFLSDTFRFVSMNLDPKHLYPSDFGTRSGNDKEQLYSKVAGYSMTATFESPVFQLVNTGIQC